MAAGRASFLEADAADAAAAAAEKKHPRPGDPDFDRPSITAAYGHYQYEEPRFSIRMLQHNHELKDSRWRWNSGDLATTDQKRVTDYRPKVDTDLLDEAFQTFMKNPMLQQGLNPNIQVPITVKNVYLIIESMGFGFSRREIDSFLDEYGQKDEQTQAETAAQEHGEEPSVMLSRNDIDRFLSNTPSTLAGEWAVEGSGKFTNPWHPVDRFVHATYNLQSSHGMEVDLEHIEHYCTTLGDELHTEEWEELKLILHDSRSRVKSKPVDLLMAHNVAYKELRSEQVPQDHKHSLQRKLDETLNAADEDSDASDAPAIKVQEPRRTGGKDTAGHTPRKTGGKDTPRA